MDPRPRSTLTEAEQPGPPPRAPSRRGRPRGSTRERILDVALELFAEDGYEQTSLREIAQRLGVTKAALYFHFERKEDILFELHMRLHALGRGAIDQLASLDNDRDRANAFPEVLDRFIEQLMDNRELVVLHVRNWQALRQVGYDERHDAENEDILQRIGGLLESPEIPLAQRVRIACSLGAIMAVLASAGQAFRATPATELTEPLRAAVSELLRPPDTRSRRTRGAAQALH